MESIRDSERLFDFTSFNFPEFLLTTLGSDSRLPYWSKCLSLGALLYAGGLLASFVSNTLFSTAANSGVPYLRDYSFMTACATLGITLALLLSTLRKLDHALVQVNKRIGSTSNPIDEQKFKEFVSWVKQWMPRGQRLFEGPVFWYYIETVGGALLGALMAIFWSVYSPSLFWGSAQFAVAALYFILFCAVLTYIIGACVFASVGAVIAARRYCKDFVTHERILALNPDRVGGLRPIGRFSLRLDVAFAMPSLVVFSYLAQGVSIANPVVVVLLLLYTIALVVVFFIPLAAAHDSMLEAKEKAYDQVNEIFKEVNSKISEVHKNFNLRRIKALKDVYFLYERVQKMAVWPLNLDIVLKFVVTSSFPIIGSLIVAYVSKMLTI